MKLFYNDIALHDYGEVVISSQAAVGKPEAAPQWWEKRLKIKLWFKETTYADNQSLANQVRAVLKSLQQAVLKVLDDLGNELINQTATIVDHDQPEQPNEKGTYLQSIEIEFQYVEVFGETQKNTLNATFQRTGGTLITLGFVEGVKYSQDVRRYSEFHSHRAYASGRLEVRGRFVGDPLADLGTRRAALLVAADQMRSEITSGMDGQFKFGSIDKLIRVDNFVAEYDQAVNFIPWSLSATFTEFPNESGYAQAEFVLDTRQDLKEGKVILGLSGTVVAESESHALSKLASIRTSVAPSSTWTMLRGGGGRAEQIDGEDGATFIRLSFDEEFEKTISGMVEWELHVSDAEEVQEGIIRRTYSGHVDATASDFQTAYNAATIKAKALGDHRHQFKLSGTVSCDDKQFSAQQQISGNPIVRVEFSYEYRLKGTRIFAEVNSEFDGETFGLDVETVSGFVNADTVASARAFYNLIRNSYSSFMVRNERVTESRQKVAKDALVPVGPAPTYSYESKSPPTLTGSAAITVNSTEYLDDSSHPDPAAIARGPANTPPLGAGYVKFWAKLDFSFSIHRPKSAATTNIAIRYEYSRTQDFLARENTSVFTGTVWSSSESAANTFLDGYFSGAGVGNRTISRRSAGYEKAPPSANAKFADRAKDYASGGSYFLAMNFEDTFVDLMTGDTIIKCDLQEQIVCSGTRNVVQATAEGNDVLQQCGTSSGKRVVSGSVTATSETICITWIRKQLTFPLAQYVRFGVDDHGNPLGQTARNPLEVEFKFESIPLRELKPRNDDGSPNTDDTRAKFATASFNFEELATQVAIS